MGEPRYYEATATFDALRHYRYPLVRAGVAERPRGASGIRPPSTADESSLDPTLRRCLGYARAWGFGSFEIGNLFAFRSTEPKWLSREKDPVGPANDRALAEVAGRAKLVVCGWGTWGWLHGRGGVVQERVLAGFDLHILKLTQDGHPSHPLYLRGDLQPVLWRPRRAA